MESLGQFYFRAAKKYGVPVRIAHSHNSATEPTLKGKVKGILAKRFPMYATHCFACSELAGRFMFGDRDFTVIKNAIDLSRFQYDEKIRTEMRAELNLTDKFVIGQMCIRDRIWIKLELLSPIFFFGIGRTIVLD